jgi:hypothetical protein
METKVETKPKIGRHKTSSMLDSKAKVKSLNIQPLLEKTVPLEKSKHVQALPSPTSLKSKKSVMLESITQRI